MWDSALGRFQHLVKELNLLLFWPNNKFLNLCILSPNISLFSWNQRKCWHLLSSGTPDVLYVNKEGMTSSVFPQSLGLQSDTTACPSAQPEDDAPAPSCLLFAAAAEMLIKKLCPETVPLPTLILTVLTLTFPKCILTLQSPPNSTLGTSPRVLVRLRE